MISTNPDNGNSVAKNSTVTVNVSTGRREHRPAQPPGSQATAAEQQLKNLGFTNVNPVSDTQSTAPSGTGRPHDPGAGQLPAEPADHAVRVRRRHPGAQRGEPDRGRGAGDPEAGRVHTCQTTSTPAPASQMVQPGTVYNQNPAANQVEPKGTLIQIFVQPQNGTPTPTPVGLGHADRHIHADAGARPPTAGRRHHAEPRRQAWAACSGQRGFGWHVPERIPCYARASCITLTPAH